MIWKLNITNEQVSNTWFNWWLLSTFVFHRKLLRICLSHIVACLYKYDYCWSCFASFKCLTNWFTYWVHSLTLYFSCFLKQRTLHIALRPIWLDSYGLVYISIARNRCFECVMVQLFTIIIPTPRSWSNAGIIGHECHRCYWWFKWWWFNKFVKQFDKDMTVHFFAI